MNQIFRYCKFEPCLLSRSYGNQGKSPTHYEVLRVPETASQKDIKTAFIKLSKEMHPDIKGDTSHNEFVKINEAYRVLSKEILKRDYDINLKYGISSDDSSFSPNSHQYRSESTGFNYYDEPNIGSTAEYERLMEMQMKERNNVIRRRYIRNFFIFAACITLMTFGMIMQIMVMNKRILENQDFIFERNFHYTRRYNGLRERAKFTTKDQQSQDFVTKAESTKSDNLETDPLKTKDPL